MSNMQSAIRAEPPDIVDAEFETIGRAPKAAIPDPGRARPRPASPGAAILRTGERQAREWFQPAGPGFWAAGMLAACAAFWLSGGHALVGTLSDPGERARPLRVASFASRVESGQHGPMLSVDGELANDGRAAVAVPPFAIDITTEDGATMRYFISEDRQTIRAGGLYRFSSRLAVPARRIERVTITLDDKSIPEGA